MSFFSDLFEGKFGNLGRDITHAPSSLIAHPAELAATLGGAALIAAPFIAPEIAGLGGAAAGAGDIGAGALAGDIGAGTLATDLGIGDIGTAAAADLGTSAFTEGAIAGGDVLAAGAPAVASDALAFAPEVAPEAVGLGSDTFGSVSSDVLSGAAGGDVLTGPGDFVPSTLDTAATTGDTAGATTGFAAQTSPTTGVATAAPGATPSGFAATDAELSGATTGTAPTATTTTAAPATPSLTDKLGGVLNSPWTRLGAGLAPLGLALARGEPKLPPQAQQAQGLAGQVGAFGSQQLAAGQAGTLNPGQQALINNMRNDLTNKWRQTLFNQGVQDPSKDSRWPQIEAQIDAQVTQQTQTMIQQTIQNGLQATGQASGVLTNIANTQMASDNQFTTNLVNATKSLGTAVGGQTITLRAA